MSKKRNVQPYTPTRGRFAGRSFKSRHVYRNAMARAKGYKNYYQERVAYKPLPSRKRIESQSRVIQQKRADAFEVLGIMRRTGSNMRPAIRYGNDQVRHGADT